MGKRVIERNIARALYREFSRKWRAEKRLAGKAGRPGYRKPTFSQWHALHLRDQEMMKASTPIDVQEYLGQDPWDASPRRDGTDTEPKRGVTTVPIVEE